ncbi:MAG: hypothetical protein K2X26_10040 [Chitinophagaceae bacterium]|nr:hypothetical protein [Chitinophagaceae bacterium]
MIYTLKSVLSLFLIFSCTNLIAQLPTLQSSGWDRIMMVTDINGRPFRPNYVDVVGHPFLLKDFKWGNIEFLNGRKLENIPCRIDVVSNFININTPNNEEINIESKDIKELIFIDSSEPKPIPYIFKTHLPKAFGHNENEFYQLLVDGKVSLFKSTTKRIDTRKDDISGDATREFAIYIEYYVLKNNEFIRLKKEKKFIMDLLSDKSDLMKNVFNSYKTVIRNDIDIIKILDIYNKL